MVGVISCPLLITKYPALYYNSVHSLRMRTLHALRFMRFVAWGYVSIKVADCTAVYVCIMTTASIIELYILKPVNKVMWVEDTRLF